jgi:hypothetical protein
VRAPGFAEGVTVALASAIAAGALTSVLGSIVGAPLALRVVVAVVGLGYFLYLLAATRARVGRVSALLAWSLLTGVTLALDPPLLLHLCTQVGLAWMLRALRVHRSVLPALADLALATLSVAAAVWAAERTASVSMAAWCLLLVQAACVAIPRRGARRGTAASPGEPFALAQRSAEAALRRLASTR